MFFVYVLRSLNHDRMYIGMSADPNKRLVQHNAGLQKSTKPFRPYRLILIEECVDRKQARLREKFLKSGCGREYIKKIYSPVAQ